MTDIYPQSPKDSAALLAEQHPLMARIKELESELAATRKPLKQMRIESGLTQKKLAELLNMSVNYYRNIELGSTPQPEGLMKRAAEAIIGHCDTVKRSVKKWL